MRFLRTIALILAFLASLPATAGTVGYFDVRGSIPSSAQLGQPFRWSAQPDGNLANHPCVLYLWTYGNSGPDGYYEFPSVVFPTLGNAADWCRGLSPGQTVCMDGRIVWPPDPFGQTYIVDNARFCQ